MLGVGGGGGGRWDEAAGEKREAPATSWDRQRLQSNAKQSKLEINLNRCGYRPSTTLDPSRAHTSNPPLFLLHDRHLSSRRPLD